jgi:glyoxylase-like metal-dependent hydrolase (beta-lactamase superfamily II)
MLQIECFTFNPFQENTYVLWDETLDCIIIDPGCSNKYEQDELVSFIEKNKLKPVKLINTHCHIDHVMGNAFIAKRFGIDLYIHKDDLFLLENVENIGKMYGISVNSSPPPKYFLDENQSLDFGNVKMKIFHTPGHSPGSISFYDSTSKILVVGDVLFNGSIGRTDLPGGDYETLIQSIKHKLLPLGDDVLVYSGHGTYTNIGKERLTNPFLN